MCVVGGRFLAIHHPNTLLNFPNSRLQLQLPAHRREAQPQPGGGTKVPDPLYRGHPQPDPRPWPPLNHRWKQH